jgi:hypothetical protein
MIYSPACLRWATTKTIMSVSANVASAGCVDNALLLGTGDTVFSASKEFIVRSALVGAQLKDTTIHITTEYDFLGEHNNHVAQTRRVTDKTAAKALFVSTFLLVFFSLLRPPLQRWGGGGSMGNR